MISAETVLGIASQAPSAASPVAHLRLSAFTPLL
jgi:hypothetical protein